MKLRITLFTLGLLLCGPLHAADIYKWVDESGRTQMSDVVPEKFKNTATRIDSKKSEIGPEQRKEAEDRASREKARAAEARGSSSGPGSIESGNGATAARIAASTPRPSNTADADCPTLRRLYRESQMCFAPYRLVNGTTKAEGFEKCTVVVDPILKCGMESSN